MMLITSSAMARSSGGTERGEDLPSLQVDDELELALLLHREIGAFLALKDAADIASDLAISFDKI
jgi:hypothetical protein